MKHFTRIISTNRKKLHVSDFENARTRISTRSRYKMICYQVISDSDVGSQIKGNKFGKPKLLEVFFMREICYEIAVKN